jgi:hypothetical protein
MSQRARSIRHRAYGVCLWKRRETRPGWHQGRQSPGKQEPRPVTVGESAAFMLGEDVNSVSLSGNGQRPHAFTRGACTDQAPMLTSPQASRLVVVSEECIGTPGWPSSSGPCGEPLNSRDGVSIAVRLASTGNLRLTWTRKTLPGVCRRPARADQRRNEPCPMYW